MVDFSPLPPEVLSGLMYTGPGSGPLMQAAAAWSTFAEELTTTATSIQSQVSGLGSTWQGPAAAASTSAITPLVTWMEATAAQAAQMASQATTAAGLFETAHAATVPPPVVAANRALLLALIATNFFGQNTPSIMATEAQYEAMWGQDVAAAHAYSAASESNNNALPKTTAPPHAGNGQSTPVVSGDNATSQAVNAAGNANPAASGDGGSPWLNRLGDLLGLNHAGDGTVPDVPTTPGGGADLGMVRYLYLAALPARILPSLLMQLARMGSMGAAGSAAGLAGQTGAAAGTGALMGQIGDFVNDKMQGAVGTLVGHFNSATQSISAKLGQAASMGSLKVPQGWSAAADGMVRAAPVLPNTTVSAPMAAASPGGMGGMPGGPFGNALMGALAGRGIGGVAAKAPKVIPRSPAGG